MTVPARFQPHARRSPATDPWQPIYSAQDDAGLVLGILVAEPHCNSRGFVHGGVIATLSDNAMGYSCAARAGDGFRAVTVGLSVDYVSSARLGEWVEFRTHFMEIGRSLAFAECRVTAAARCVARANATFRRIK